MAVDNENIVKTNPKDNLIDVVFENVVVYDYLYMLNNGSYFIIKVGEHSSKYYILHKVDNTTINLFHLDYNKANMLGDYITTENISSFKSKIQVVYVEEAYSFIRRKIEYLYDKLSLINNFKNADNHARKEINSCIEALMHNSNILVEFNLLNSANIEQDFKYNLFSLFAENTKTKVFRDLDSIKYYIVDIKNSQYKGNSTNSKKFNYDFKHNYVILKKDSYGVSGEAYSLNDKNLNLIGTHLSSETFDSNDCITIVDTETIINYIDKKIKSLSESKDLYNMFNVDITDTEVENYINTLMENKSKIERFNDTNGDHTSAIIKIDDLDKDTLYRIRNINFSNINDFIGEVDSFYFIPKENNITEIQGFIYSLKPNYDKLYYVKNIKPETYVDVIEKVGSNSRDYTNFITLSFDRRTKQQKFVKSIKHSETAQGIIFRLANQPDITKLFENKIYNDFSKFLFEYATNEDIQFLSNRSIDELNTVVDRLTLQYWDKRFDAIIIIDTAIRDHNTKSEKSSNSAWDDFFERQPDDKTEEHSLEEEEVKNNSSESVTNPREFDRSPQLQDLAGEDKQHFESHYGFFTVGNPSTFDEYKSNYQYSIKVKNLIRPSGLDNIRYIIDFNGYLFNLKIESYEYLDQYNLIKCRVWHSIDYNYIVYYDANLSLPVYQIKQSTLHFSEFRAPINTLVIDSNGRHNYADYKFVEIEDESEHQQIANITTNIFGIEDISDYMNYLPEDITDSIHDLICLYKIGKNSEISEAFNKSIDTRIDQLKARLNRTYRSSKKMSDYLHQIKTQVNIKPSKESVDHKKEDIIDKGIEVNFPNDLNAENQTITTQPEYTSDTSESLNTVYKTFLDWVREVDQHKEEEYQKSSKESDILSRFMEETGDNIISHHKSVLNFDNRIFRLVQSGIISYKTYSCLHCYSDEIFNKLIYQNKFDKFITLIDNIINDNFYPNTINYINEMENVMKSIFHNDTNSKSRLIQKHLLNLISEIKQHVSNKAYKNEEETENSLESFISTESKYDFKGLKHSLQTLYQCKVISANTLHELISDEDITYKDNIDLLWNTLSYNNFKLLFYIIEKSALYQQFNPLYPIHHIKDLKVNNNDIIEACSKLEKNIVKDFNKNNIGRHYLLTTLYKLCSCIRSKIKEYNYD